MAGCAALLLPWVSSVEAPAVLAAAYEEAAARIGDVVCGVDLDQFAQERQTVRITDRQQVIFEARRRVLPALRVWGDTRINALSENDPGRRLKAARSPRLRPSAMMCWST